LERRHEYLFVINGTTGTVTDDDISISSFPVSMAVNNETNIVYIAGANHSSGHTIAELHVINGGVNGTSYNTENYILNGTVPSSMAVDPERNLIYALESGKLSVIDGKTYNQTDVIELKGVKSTDETLFDRNRNIIYTTNSENNSISVIDGKSRNVINDIHLTEIVPSDMAFDPVGNELYVSGQVNYSPFRLVDSVLRLDPTNESRGKPILLGGISGDIAVNTFTNKIYALNEDPAGVTIIDTK
jgi:YVTN family beta-propeller protein